MGYRLELFILVSLLKTNSGQPSSPTNDAGALAHNYSMFSIYSAIMVLWRSGRNQY